MPCTAIDNLPHVYTFTCPNCGAKVKVPVGHRIVVPTPSRGGKRTGITIDGKPVHRCNLDAPPPTP
jgi:hypothetical protein